MPTMRPSWRNCRRFLRLCRREVCPRGQFKPPRGERACCVPVVTEIADVVDARSTLDVGRREALEAMLALARDHQRR
jgi:hypothetical protein